MDHARDDVFACPAFALDQDRNIGCGHFVEAFTHRPHAVRPAEDHCFGWKLTQSLD